MAGRKATHTQTTTANWQYAYRGLTKKKASDLTVRGHWQKSQALQLVNDALCMAAFRYLIVSGEMFSAVKEQLHNASSL